MARQRLTNQTLTQVARVANAEHAVALAEKMLGPGASDREVVAAARQLQAMGAGKIRNLNAMSERIATETGRMAGNGGVDVLPEAGPNQPDPTDTQAYVKEIETTPDHSVADSLTKRDKIAPTATRRRPTRKADLEDFEPDQDDGDDDLGMDDEVSFGDDSDDGDDDHCGMHSEGDDNNEFDLDSEDQDLEAMLEFASDGDSGDGGDDGDDGLGDHMMSDDSDDDTDDADAFDDDNDSDDVQEPDIVDEDDLDDSDDDEPDDFLDEDETDVAHASQERGASRRNRGRRASKGNDFSLEDTMSIEAELGDLDGLEGDDLEALMGSKVTRTASQNHGVTGSVPKLTARDREEGFTWNTEDEPELAGRVRKAGKNRRANPPKPQRPRRVASSHAVEAPQIRKPKARSASSKQAPNFTPDRRRVAGSRQAAAGDEFDSVFGAPDVNSYFND